MKCQRIPATRKIVGRLVVACRIGAGGQYHRRPADDEIRWSVRYLGVHGKRKNSVLKKRLAATQSCSIECSPTNPPHQPSTTALSAANVPRQYAGPSREARVEQPCKGTLATATRFALPKKNQRNPDNNRSVDAVKDGEPHFISTTFPKLFEHLHQRLPVHRSGGAVTASSWRS